MRESGLLNSRLITILIALFTVALGYGVILPVLPFYTERLALGAGATFEDITLHIGFLTSIFPFFQMFFAPLWGRWSDKLGRKPLIKIGLLGYVLMQLLIGLSTSLWMLYVARIIGGVFTSAIIPVSYALVSDLTTEDNRTTGIALAGSAYSLGIVAGPFIGGLLSHTDLHFYLKSGHFLLNDYSIPFFFLALLGLCLIPIIENRLRETISPSEKKVKKRMSPLNWPQIVKQLFPLLILSFVYQAILTSFESVFSIYSKNELQFDAITIGYGFMVCALVMALFQPIVVSRKIRSLIIDYDQIVLGYLIFGVSLFLLINAIQLLLVLILIGFFAVGGAFITPNLTSLISLKGGHSPGSALGIQKSTDSLGQVIGPIMGSWLLTINSFLPYLTVGIISMMVGVLLMIKRSSFAFNKIKK